MLVAEVVDEPKLLLLQDCATSEMSDSPRKVNFLETLIEDTHYAPNIKVVQTYFLVRSVTSVR